MRITMRLVIFAGMGLAAVSFGQTAGTQKAGEQKTEVKAVKPGATVQPKSVVTLPGMVISIDPDTKEVRPATPAEINALSALAPNSAAVDVEPQARQLTGPLGGVLMTLPDSSQNYMVVTKTPDGKLKMSEVTGGEAAKKLVEQGPQPTSGMVQKKEKANDQ